MNDYSDCEKTCMYTEALNFEQTTCVLYNNCGQNAAGAGGKCACITGTFFVPATNSCVVVCPNG